MINKVAVLLVVLLFIIAALASDPDPVIDFCIAKSPDNSFSCKNSSTATVEDFTYSGIKSPGNFKQTGFSSMAVNSNVFPGFNTLSVSFVCVSRFRCWWCQCATLPSKSNRGCFCAGRKNLFRICGHQQQGFCQSVGERRGHGVPKRPSALSDECWRWACYHFGQF